MSLKVIAKALAAFGAAALAVLLAVTIYVVRHREDAQATQKIAGVLPDSLLHAKNFHWTQMKAGQMQWVLTAADASYSADRTAVELSRADLDMTSTDGKHVHITAPQALLYMNGNHINRANLTGGAVIRYGDFVLSTDSASFEPDADQVAAAGLVTIVGEGVKVTGIGLTGSPKTRIFKLHQQVSTEIAPSKNSAKPKKS
ncbi:MAG TPA: LPS export ABC transporter periplasmic protein LptC [Candidatus Binataceae bacterium]|nr:LPS export ABC transporter periplasmic protein LptC [Candidatus Binataceae bacterium]